MTKEEISKYVIKKNTKMADAMKKIDDNSAGIVFVTDDNNCLCGSLTDGDMRRWLLMSGSLESEARLMMKTTPISLPVSRRSEARELMRQNVITALPIVDEQNEIVDICFLQDIGTEIKQLKNGLCDVPVVIMAGGKGTRLYPYTKILPKPLIPIGDIPIIERVMERFYEYGVKTFYLSVNYKKNMIQSYFSDNEKAYRIEYIEENTPLGTAGSLKLIKAKIEKALFVANCDCLISADYEEVYNHHIESKNAITMVVSVKNETIPYGVVRSNENGELIEINEKPTRSYMINTGMYVINPEIIEFIPDDSVFHMTDLIDKAKKLHYRIGIYPVSEDSFLDMGEIEEMKRMEEKLGIIQ